MREASVVGGAARAGAAPRIAVLFHRLGPSHHARLAAAARRTEICAVEFSEADHTYAWSKVERGGPFTQVTLFNDREIDAQPLARVVRRLARVLGRARPDVVAVPGWSSRGALAALLWCRCTGTPAVMMSASTERDHVRRPAKEFGKRQILRLCSTALAGGKAQADYLERLGLPRERISVGYDVVDNAYFAAGAAAARAAGPRLRAELGLPERFFLVSSRLVPKKNIARVLAAYARYRALAGDGAWGLVVVGDGPEAGPLRAAVTQHGLDASVVMPGFKQYHELPAYYGLADAFVLASTSEQWGLVVNEAMAAGLPVLVSRHCGCAPDLLAEERNGFGFAPEDVPGLAALMVRMASATTDRASMANASREIIRSWSPDTFADGLIVAARMALAGRRAAGPGEMSTGTPRLEC